MRSYLLPSAVGDCYMEAISAGICCPFSAPHQDVHSGNVEENVLIGLGQFAGSLRIKTFLWGI